MDDLTRLTLDRALALSDLELQALFRRLEHDGRALPIGQESDDVISALHRDRYAPVEVRDLGEDGLWCVAVRRRQVVVACDAFGPWAATVELDDLYLGDPAVDASMLEVPRPFSVALGELLA